MARRGPRDSRQSVHHGLARGIDGNAQGARARSALTGRAWPALEIYGAPRRPGPHHRQPFLRNLTDTTRDGPEEEIRRISVFMPPEAEIPIYVTRHASHKKRHAREAAPPASRRHEPLTAVGASITPHGPDGARHRGSEGCTEQGEASRQADQVARHGRQGAYANDDDRSLEDKYPGALRWAFLDRSQCAFLSSRCRRANSPSQTIFTILQAAGQAV